MKEKRYGKIVNISSRASLGKQRRTGYSATKAAIIGMTRSLALELAPYNINVNCVGPGPIVTELFDHVNPKESPATQALIQNIPLQRLGTPKDVAALVAFLASQEASFITGQTIYICGGLSVGSIVV
jgi:NAD(P)-dependent dehydrogenase (short-subunit alcohol dehydrogenase family)